MPVHSGELRMSVAPKTSLFRTFSFFVALTLGCGIFVVSMLLAPQTRAANGINRQMNYQAKLLDASGNPVANGDYSIKFSLYDAASAGNRLWAATGTLATPGAITVSVQNGLFTILLGDTSATGGGQNSLDGVDWNSDSIYLGVTVAADAEMTPRKRFAAAPQAFNSQMLQGMYASSTIGGGNSLFVVNQGANDAATGTRTALEIRSSGTSNVFDYLLRAINDLGATVFSVNRAGNVTSSGYLAVTGSSSSTFAGSVEVLGNVSSSQMTVSGQHVCLVDGSNCPTTTDMNWAYDVTNGFVRTNTSTNDLLLGNTATSTGAPAYFDMSGQTSGTSTVYFAHNTNTNVIIGGTSSSVGFMNTELSLNGNDLFVAGNIGSASSVYTNGEFVAGTGSTRFGDGYINKTNGNLTLAASGGYVLPSSNLAVSLGSSSQRFNGVFGSVTSTEFILANGVRIYQNVGNILLEANNGLAALIGGTTGGNFFYGDINAGNNNVYNLGTFGNAWKSVYASGTYYGTGLEVANSTTTNATNTNLYVSGTASTTALYANGVTTTNLGVAGTLLVGGQGVCLFDGSNCPVGADLNWTYDPTNGFVRTATSTNDLVIGNTVTSTGAPAYFDMSGQTSGTSTVYFAHNTNTNVIIGGTSSSVSFMNTELSLNGNDLFVAGNIGSASSVYTNGEFVAGTGSTHFGSGYVNESDGELLIQTSAAFQPLRLYSGFGGYIYVGGVGGTSNNGLVPVTDNGIKLGVGDHRWSEINLGQLGINITDSAGGGGFSILNNSHVFTIRDVLGNNTDFYYNGAISGGLGGPSRFLFGYSGNWPSLNSTPAEVNIGQNTTDFTKLFLGIGPTQVRDAFQVGLIYGAQNSTGTVFAVRADGSISSSSSAMFAGGVTSTNLYVSGTASTTALYANGVTTTNLAVMGTASTSELVVSNLFTTFGTVSTTDLVVSRNATTTNVTTTALAVTGAGTTRFGGSVSTTALVLNPGTVGAPAISFSNGTPNTGIYSLTANTLDFAQGGVQAMTINGSNVAVYRGFIAGSNNTIDIGAPTGFAFRNIYASGTLSYITGLGWTNATGTNTTSTNLYVSGTASTTALYANGATTTNLFVAGTASTTALYVAGQLVCLADGTNCTTASFGGADLNWTYDPTNGFVRTNTSTNDLLLGNTATSTGAPAYFDMSGQTSGTSTVYFAHNTNTNVIIGGTSSSVGFMNTDLSLNGNDLFVAGNIGSASSVYTNGEFVAGTGSTRFGDGYINKTNGNLTLAVSGGYVLPSSDLLVQLGNASARFNGYFGSTTSTNATTTGSFRVGGTATVGGFLGVNTTAPSSTFEVDSSGGANSGINLRLTNASSYAPIDFNTPGGLAGQFLMTGASWVTSGAFAANELTLANELTSGGLHLAAIGTSGFIKFTVGGNSLAAERMRILANGNVGIGTTAPSATLDVNGTVSSTNLFVQGNATTTNVTTTNLYVSGTASTTNLIVNTLTANNFSWVNATGTNTTSTNLAILGYASTTHLNVSDGYYYGGISSPMNVEITRTSPTTTGATVDIGSFFLLNGAHNVRVTMTDTEESSPSSISKTYLISSQYDGTAGVWEVVPPVVDSGSYNGNDLALDARGTTHTLSLRVRRVSGSSTGTVYVRVESTGMTKDAFTASSAVGFATAPTALYEPFYQSTLSDRVGIGTVSPSTKLDVYGTVSSTGLYVNGSSTSTGNLTVGTSTLSVALNTNFVMSGDDLYVGGNIGSVSSVYTNGAFVAGTGSTWYGNGYINKTDGNLILAASGGYILPSSDLAVQFGNASTRFNGYFGNTTSTNATTTNIAVSGFVGSNLVPATSTYNFGSAVNSWNDIYASGTIYGVSQTLTGTSTAGQYTFADDAGAVTAMDMAVTASAPSEQEMSYGFSIDGTPYLQMYSRADAAGGLQTTSTAIRFYQSMLPMGNNLLDLGAIGTNALRNIYASGTLSMFSGLNWVDATGTNVTTTNLTVLGNASTSQLSVDNLFTVFGTVSTTDLMVSRNATTTNLNFTNASGSKLIVGSNAPGAGLVGIGGATSTLGTVFIDSGAATNVPGIYMNRQGEGNSGVKMAYNSGGSLELGAMNGFSSSWISTLRGSMFWVNNMALETQGHPAFQFQADSAASLAVMSIRGSANQTADMLQIKTTAASTTPVFVVNASGKVTIGGYSTSTINGTAMLGVLGTASSTDLIVSNISTTTKLSVIDSIDNSIRSTTNIASLGNIDLNAAPVDIAVAGRYAYTIHQGGTSGELSVVDIRNAGRGSGSVVTTTTIGSGATSPQAIAVSGRYAYVTAVDGLHIFDISTTSTVDVATLTAFNGLRNVVVSGRYAYVTEVTGGRLTIIDILNPASATSVGSVAITQPRGLAVQGHYAYVPSLDTDALKIVDISNPAAPVIVGSALTSDQPIAVAVQGRYAYVNGQGSQLIDIIDISAAPSPITVTSTFVNAFGTNFKELSVSGRYLYAATENDLKLHIFDVSNASSPVELRSFTTYVRGHVVAGRYAYMVSNTANRIQIIDIGGTETNGLLAHSAELGNLEVLANGRVGNNLIVGGGLNVGANGILSEGALDVSSTSTSSTFAGSLQALGHVSSTGGIFDTFATVMGKNVCLQDGTNCSTTSFGGADLNWTYDPTNGFVRTATSTNDLVFGNTATSTGAPVYFDMSGQTSGTSTVYFAHNTNTNVIIGGTSSSVGFMNTAFNLNGNDLFVASNIGSASSVYTNGEFVVGTGSTHFGNGYINKNDGNFTFAVSGGYILPSSDGAVQLGNATTRFNGYFGNVTSTNVTTTALSVTGSATTTFAGAVSTTQMRVTAIDFGSGVGGTSSISAGATSMVFMAGPYTFLSSGGTYNYMTTLYPATNNSYTLGTPGLAWASLDLSGAIRNVGTATSTFAGPVSSTKIVANSLGVNIAMPSTAAEILGTVSSTNLIVSLSATATNVTTTNLAISGYVGSSILPATTTYNLGGAINSWNDIYASGTFYGVNQTLTGTSTAGQYTFADDAGAVTAFDMAVTASAASEQTMAYEFDIDGNPFLQMYSRADAAGGLQTTSTAVRFYQPLLPAGSNSIDIGAIGTNAIRDIYASGTLSMFSGLNWVNATGSNVTTTNIAVLGTVSTSQMIVSNLFTTYGTVSTTNLMVSDTATTTRLHVVSTTGIGTDPVSGYALKVNAPQTTGVSGYFYNGAGTYATLADGSAGQYGLKSNSNIIANTYIAASGGGLSTLSGNVLISPAQVTVMTLGSTLINNAVTTTFTGNVGMGGASALYGTSLNVLGTVSSTSLYANGNGTSTGNFSVGTSSLSVTLSTPFAVNGNDLYVGGNIGSVSSVFTNGAFVASTTGVGLKMYGGRAELSQTPILDFAGYEGNTMLGVRNSERGVGLFGGQGILSYEELFNTLADTNPASIYSGVMGYGNVGGTGAVVSVSGTVAGLTGIANVTQAGGLIQDLVGVKGRAGGPESLMVNRAIGIMGSVDSGDSTMNIAEAIGLYAGPIENAAGPITLAEGLKVDAPGYGTTRWTAAIGTGNSYIAGNLSIGQSVAPTTALDVRGTVSSTNMIVSSVVTTTGLYATEATTTNLAVLQGLNNVYGSGSAMRVVGSATVATSTFTRVTPFGSHRALVTSYIGNSISIVDLTNPASPRLGKTIFPNSGPWRSAVQGDYGYVLGYDAGSFSVLDMSTSSLSIVGTITGLSNAGGLAVSGRYAYVAYNSGFAIIDITNPYAPILKSTITAGSGLGLGVDVQGNYAYLTNVGSGLYVIDITNPNLPVIVGNYPGLIQPRSVIVKGIYAYIVSTSGHFNVLNVNTSTAPTMVATTTVMTGPSGDLSIQGRYAYAPDATQAKLYVFDILDPTAPTQRTALSIANAPFGVGVNGKYVYITDNNNLLQVIDTGGIETTGITAASANFGTLFVDTDGTISKHLTVDGGVNIGTGGLLVQGHIGSVASSTSSTVKFVNTNAYTEIGTAWGGYIDQLLIGAYEYATGTDDYEQVIAYNKNRAGLCLFELETGDIPAKTCPINQTTASIVADEAVNGSAFDVAERYPITGTATSSDLLVWDTAATGTAKLSPGIPYDPNIAGIVSTKPAFLLGWYGDVIVALTGRVPTKVSAANGAIRVGDPLTTSQYPGVAMKATKPGMIVGYALENATATSTIEVFVKVGYNAAAVLATDGTITQVNDNLVFAATSTATATSTSVDSWGITFRGSAWDGVQAISTEFSILNDVSSPTSSEISIRNSSSTSVFSVDQSGNTRVSGDVILSGKLYPSARGVAQTSKYIFLDDSAAPTSTYMATNADGWQANDSYDFAERYYSPDKLDPGDLVLMSQTGRLHVQRATDGQHMLMGIVSTRPAFVAGRPATSTYPIALAGRVPTKVSTMNGVIKIGDSLAASTIPGVAVKALQAGPIVGMALENYDVSDVGMIEVFVNPTWWGGDSAPVATSPTPTATAPAPTATVSSQGLARVLAGGTKVHVSYASIFAYPHVVATPHASVGSEWWTENLTDVGFDIRIAAPTAHDITFSWEVTPAQTGETMFLSDGTFGAFDPSTGALIVGTPMATSTAPTATSSTTATVTDPVPAPTPTTTTTTATATTTTATVTDPVVTAPIDPAPTTTSSTGSTPVSSSSPPTSTSTAVAIP